jgi:hypothetical protein
MPANAKPRDAQAGWQIYRESGYQATLEEINAEPTRRGFGEIRQRSYVNYRKLHRYGYQRCVPTNIVDVETHHNPPWGSLDCPWISAMPKFRFACRLRRWLDSPTLA